MSPYFTIVQIIFHFIWDDWAHCGSFENGILLMYTLEGISSGKLRTQNVIRRTAKTDKTVRKRMLI